MKSPLRFLAGVDDRCARFARARVRARFAGIACTSFLLQSASWYLRGVVAVRAPSAALVERRPSDHRVRHVEVAPRTPDLGGAEHDGGDESQRARAVGECADRVDAALDLAVEPLDAVRRA